MTHNGHLKCSYQPVASTAKAPKPVVGSILWDTSINSYQAVAK